MEYRNDHQNNLLTNMPDGFAYFKVVTDEHDQPIDCIFLQVNPAFTKITDLAENMIRGKRVKDLYLGQNNLNINWVGTYKQLLTTEKPVHFESYFDYFDRWFEITVYLDRPFFVGAIIRDITERKKIEEALHGNAERLDLAMAVKNEGMWDWNLLTNETYFDTRYYTMAGYQPDEFPNSFNSWAERVHEEDLPKAQQSIDAYLKGKSDQFNIEFRFKKKDGQWMWINGKGKIYGRDESGSPLRMIGTHTDITDRKQAEAEIRRLNEELEQRVKERTIQLESANKELEAFAYSVSHDLRAPLRAMSGFSEVLQADYCAILDDQGKHYLSRIQTASNRMGKLIDDLLNLSKVTRIEFQYEQVDLSKMAADLLADFQVAEPDRQVVVEIVTGMSARGDKHLLHLALENLLSNAWKFSSKNSQARIEVGITAEEKSKTFYVKDNGTGFDMAYSNKLYAPFQRLHGDTEFTGTGIGLSIVSRIINRHGGKVWAQGEIGRGATFYFSLPG